MRNVTLYGMTGSGNSMKPKWVAERTGWQVSWNEIDVFKGETRTPAFLALNPAGQVPVAVFADGRTLAQSNAIMLFLAQGSDLIPDDVFARAKMFEWLFWEQYSHEPTIAVRIARKYYLGEKEDALDPALLTKGNAALARMELALSGNRFLVGEALSLADIALVAYTRVAHWGGFDLGSYPGVAGWVDRVETALGLDSGAAAA
ncbi:MAG: glutathione S-transferase family protein [Hyphomonadaceae bacterium]